MSGYVPIIGDEPFDRRRPRVSRKRVSTHFRIEEFDSGDGTLVRPRDYEAIAHLCAWWLEPLRIIFGPVTVHSGYRSARRNATVGGAPFSVHLLRTNLPQRPAGSGVKAAAADVTCASGSPSSWARWAVEHRRRFPHLLDRGRGGIGHYAGFVHLDTATARDWLG